MDFDFLSLSIGLVGPCQSVQSTVCNLNHPYICVALLEVGPMLSISQNVCMFVCLSVCHTFSLRLTFFLPILPEVQWSNFLDIQNPWGKELKRKGLKFELFCCRDKNFFKRFFFLCSLRLNIFWPPIPKVQCPNFLDIQNSWGKVM